MLHPRRIPLAAALLFVSLQANAAKIEFASRELFHVPFGDMKETLGAKTENGNFLVPRDFSIDGLDHFYVNDAIKHRVVRYSHKGEYQMAFGYPAGADQVFAQPDGRGNLWLLVSDPTRGFYYGVYDVKGKRIREGVFGQYNRFRLHVDDARVLHIILSNRKTPEDAHFYFLDQESYLLKRVKAAAPPKDHHQLNKLEKSYYIDPVPAGSVKDADQKMKITDQHKQEVGTIQGRVVYVTDASEIYTRVDDCLLYVYSLDGSRLGEVKLKGLPSACTGARFDGDGNVYLLDGMPDQDGRYSEKMSGMRLLKWERR